MEQTSYLTGNCVDMRSSEKNNNTIVDENSQNSSDDERPMKQPKQQKSMQRMQPQYQQQQQFQQYQPQPVYPQQMMGMDNNGRRHAIRESRIKDRPVPQESRDSSLKIKIELDLEVEVSHIFIHSFPAFLRTPCNGCRWTFTRG